MTMVAQTCFADMMLADSDVFYFLTTCGKAFQRRFVARSHVSITGCKASDTMSSQSVTVRGEVRELESDRPAIGLLRDNPLQDAPMLLLQTLLKLPVEVRWAIPYLQAGRGKG